MISLTDRSVYDVPFLYKTRSLTLFFAEGTALFLLDDILSFTGTKLSTLSDEFNFLEKQGLLLCVKIHNTSAKALQFDAVVLIARAGKTKNARDFLQWFFHDSHILQTIKAVLDAGYTKKQRPILKLVEKE